MKSDESVSFLPERVEELSREIGSALARDLTSFRTINSSTELLSINARIVAARAGESGASFAVVAGEMMELSKTMDSSFGSLEAGTAPLLEELAVLGARLSRDVKGQRLADLAATHLDLIDRNLYERSCDVRWWASDMGLVRALETGSVDDLVYASKRMGTILDSYTVYFDLVLCDLDGKVVANGRAGNYHSVGMDASRQSWFKTGLATPSGAQFGFEGVHASSFVNGERVLVYSTAVREGGLEQGRPIGVLGVIFRWDALAQNIVDNAALSSDERPFTKVLIAEKDGSVLAGFGMERGEDKIPLSDWINKSSASRFHLEILLKGRRWLLGLARSQGYETYATGWVSILMQQIDRV